MVVAHAMLAAYSGCQSPVRARDYTPILTLTDLHTATTLLLHRMKDRIGQKSLEEVVRGGRLRTWRRQGDY